MSKTAAKQPVAKHFKPDHQYKIGRVKDRATKLRLDWLQKPRPVVVSGKSIIEMGCATTADFWARNPYNEPLRAIYTIAEIEPDSLEEMAYDQGSFMASRAPELSDAPTLTNPTDNLPSQLQRVYETQINDLKQEVAGLREENKALRDLADAERREAAAREQTLREENTTLTQKFNEAKLEINFIEKKLLPKYHEKLEEKSGLGDNASSMAQLSGPFQARLADALVDRVFGFLGGSKESPKEAASERGMTSDELGIAEVGS